MKNIALVLLGILLGAGVTGLGQKSTEPPSPAATLRKIPLESVPAATSSPNGRFVAVYERSNSSTLVTRIVFRDSAGRVAFLDDYNERDYRPAQGRWTRSGRFFVYPLYSRGGHSPWHRPFVVADVQARRCYTDSDLRAGDAISEFKLSDQDTISYDVLDRTKNNWNAGVPGIARHFSLSRKIAKPK